MADELSALDLDVVERSVATHPQGEWQPTYDDLRNTVRSLIRRLREAEYGLDDFRAKYIYSLRRAEKAEAQLEELRDAQG